MTSLDFGVFPTCLGIGPCHVCGVGFDVVVLWSLPPPLLFGVYRVWSMLCVISLQWHQQPYTN